ncbi:MAG: hypothetical protein ACI9A7_001512, partial [Cyclobacteriaceae bacterium]
SSIGCLPFYVVLFLKNNISQKKTDSSEKTSLKEYSTVFIV